MEHAVAYLLILTCLVVLTVAGWCYVTLKAFLKIRHIHLNPVQKKKERKP